MPVTITWHNEAHTVVILEMAGHWTWDEVYPASQEGYTMLETVNHPVDVIVDLRQSKGLPNGSLGHAWSMIGKRHPRTGMTVLLGANTLVVTMWSILLKVHTSLAKRQDFAFAGSVEEAYALFEEQPARPSS